MKKVLFMATVVAMAFASCAKDSNGGADNNGTPLPSGEKATLSISVTAPETRATSDSYADIPEDAVSNYTVFVTDKSGEIQWKRYSSSNAAITDMLVSNEAEFVYVVANGGNLTSIANMNGLKSYLVDLNGTAPQAQAGIRWATGVSEKLVFTQNGTDFKASTRVKITFISSRITLKIVNAMNPSYNALKTDKSLILRKVVVMNASGQSLLFGTSLVPTLPNGNILPSKKFYQGIADDEFTHYPATGSFSMATNVLSDDIPSNNFDKTYYYYVFENGAKKVEDCPTIIAITGTFKDKTVYFPVHLAHYEQWAGANNFGETLTRGNSYDITVRLTCDPTVDGDGPGGEDPTDPKVTAKVEVSVELNPWNAIGLEKTFD